MSRVCVNIPKPCAGRDTPPGSSGPGGRTRGPEISLHLGRAQKEFIHGGCLGPTHYWRLKFQAIQTQLQCRNHPLCPDVTRASEGLGGNAGKVWAFLVSFCLAVYWLVRKHVVGFCIEMPSSLSLFLWSCQALSFLGNAGRLLQWVSLALSRPPPKVSTGLAWPRWPLRGLLSVRSRSWREGVFCPSRPLHFCVLTHR